MAREPTWKREIADLLKVHASRRAKKSRHADVVSFASQDKRELVLFQSFRQLEEMGFDVSSVRKFRGRHVEALVTRWKDEGLSVSTLQNRLSVLRTFSGWIGKAGMVGGTEQYLPGKIGRRVSVATYDHSWRAAGVDAEEKISSVSSYDEVVGLQLRLCHAFFLRREEAIMFRPHRADQGEFIRVWEGTKGGRERTVRVETDYQRAVLEEAKRLTPGLRAYVGGRQLSLKQALRRFNYVLERFGLTKGQLGVTAHGLRHEGLCDLFERIAGIPAPVRCADPAAVLAQADPQRLELARQRVSEAAGHARLSISGAYIGGLVGAGVVDRSPRAIAHNLQQFLTLRAKGDWSASEQARLHQLRHYLHEVLPGEFVGVWDGEPESARAA